VPHQRTMRSREPFSCASRMIALLTIMHWHHLPMSVRMRRAVAGYGVVQFVLRYGTTLLEYAIHHLVRTRRVE
jgi:hypothetical protein